MTTTISKEALQQVKIHFDRIRNTILMRSLFALDRERRVELALDPIGESIAYMLGIQYQPDFPNNYIIMLTRMMLLYELAGENVCVVGPRMQEAFANTSLEGVPFEMVKMPHRCLYIALPESESMWLWGGERTGWHKVMGLYVSLVDELGEDLTRDGSTSMILYLCGDTNPASFSAEDDSVFWFKVKLEGEKILPDGKVVGGKNLEESMKRSMDENVAFDMQDGEINAQTDEVVRALGGKDKSEDNPFIPDELRGMPKGTPIWNTCVKALRITVNMLLYMNSSNADLSPPHNFNEERAKIRKTLKASKNPKKKRVASRRLDTISNRQLVWVGPTIEFSERPENGDASGRSVKGHVRRGHWHTFLFGPMKVDGVKVEAGLRDRKLKWIAPVWVGSDTQTEERPVKKMYVMRGDREEAS